MYTHHNIKDVDVNISNDTWDSEDRTPPPHTHTHRHTDTHTHTCIPTYHSSLHDIRYHDNDVYILFPHHLPKVHRGVRQRTLGCNVLLWTVVALHVDWGWEVEVCWCLVCVGVFIHFGVTIYCQKKKQSPKFVKMTHETLDCIFTLHWILIHSKERI